MSLITRALVLLLLLFGAAHADDMTLFGVGQKSAKSGSTYTGPGDIVSGATAWYGLRAYSAAVAATGTQKAVNVRRASDNSTQDILILTSGNLDVASYNTFVGTDATASCTIAGTSMVCTGASATIHVSDPVTGTGITNPCTVTVTNGSTTATASIAGTSTSCGTVSVAETVTFQIAGFATTAYDQASTNNVTQATAGTQPQVLPSCVSTRPCLLGNQGQSTSMGGSIPNVNQPTTLVTESLITANFASAADIIATGTSTTGLNQAVEYFGSNTMACVGASRITQPASNSALHSLMCVLNGAAGAIVVDGSAATAQNIGTAATSTFIETFGRPGLSLSLTGYLMEAGVWPVGFNATQYGNMNANQAGYW